jgi:transposase
MRIPMTLESVHIVVDVCCPECGHTDQISEYDEESVEAIRNKEYICPCCAERDYDKEDE